MKTEANKTLSEVISYTISGNVTHRVDYKQHFVSEFHRDSGKYIRSNTILNGKFTDAEPFMASFPHLIDVGIMGNCLHGRSGLCQKAGIGCYQSGMTKFSENMSFSDFSRIADECSGYTDQFALGGRGDPDCHEEFEKILSYCAEKKIVPNYTTSGFAFNEEKARLSGKYCGAVAVSWYRSEYTLRAIQLLLAQGVKTNIHYVLGQNSIDEAITRLKSDDFPKEINAVIFLLHKPVGQGSEKNVLHCRDKKLYEFFDAALNKRHMFKIGFDSCTVPGILNYAKNVDLRSVDTCEGGRFSMYIGSDLIATPCSFDAEKRYGYDLHGHTVYEAWNSALFDRFREILQTGCPQCKRREFCLGGCPLRKEIVLCEEKQ